MPSSGELVYVYGSKVALLFQDESLLRTAQAEKLFWLPKRVIFHPAI